MNRGSVVRGTVVIEFETTAESVAQAIPLVRAAVKVIPTPGVIHIKTAYRVRIGKKKKVIPA